MIIVPVCEWDYYCKKELAEGRKELVQRYVLQIAAKVMHDVKARGMPGSDQTLATQFIIVFDLEGFNIRHLTSVSGKLSWKWKPAVYDNF